MFSLLNLEGSLNKSEIYVGSLDSPETQRILDDVSYGQYTKGYLLYLRQNILIAQQFDPDSYNLTGSAKPLQANINCWSPRAKADFSVSGNGILLYSGIESEKAMIEYSWISSEGQETPVIQVQSMSNIASLSPEGSRIAYDIFDAKTSHYDIWIYDINSKSRTRLTFGEVGGTSPCWSAEGNQIFYNVEADGDKSNIFSKKSDGTGEEKLLTRAESGKSLRFLPLSASPDGQFLLIGMSNESKKSELGLVDLHDLQRPVPVKKLGINGDKARFAPDGKWIVYESNESGSSEIYVSSFNGIPGKWQLSANGGSDPIWFKDRIIYYSVSMERYESIPVSFISGRPVFKLPKALLSGKSNIYIMDISNSGKRYLCMIPGNSGSAGNLSLVVNWKGLIEKNGP